MYKIAIPSKGRKVETVANLKIKGNPVFIFVNDEIEKREYLKQNLKAEIVVTNTKGITAARNFILDYFGEETKVVQFCDDVKGVYRRFGKKTLKLNWKELDKLICRGFDMCEKHGTKLFGVYPINNHFFMNGKISPAGFIIGTFCGTIVSHLRYDPELALKEDYDFTIKHILEHGKIIRFNNYAVEAKHYGNKGGCVDYRTDELEQMAIVRLMQKYPKFIRRNSRRKNEILLNFKVIK